MHRWPLVAIDPLLLMAIVLLYVSHYPTIVPAAVGAKVKYGGCLSCTDGPSPPERCPTPPLDVARRGHMASCCHCLSRRLSITSYAMSGTEIKCRNRACICVVFYLASLSGVPTVAPPDGRRRRCRLAGNVLNATGGEWTGLVSYFSLTWATHNGRHSIQSRDKTGSSEPVRFALLFRRWFRVIRLQPASRQSSIDTRQSTIVQRSPPCRRRQLQPTD